jgi:hypothetical protein
LHYCTDGEIIILSESNRISLWTLETIYLMPFNYCISLRLYYKEDFHNNGAW